MGRTRLYNFGVNINIGNGKQFTIGAMTFKDIEGALLSEKEYQIEKGNDIDINNINAEIFPQTAKAKSMIKSDYAIMDLNGKIKYQNYQYGVK